MSKGFHISDLELFKEWIKKPDSVRQILESHAKAMEGVNLYFAKIERMQSFSHKFLTTPFTPIIP